MAIAKMQKVSIVTAPSNKDHLLYTLQTMQNIQVSDLSLKVTGQDFTFNNNYQSDQDYQVICGRLVVILSFKDTFCWYWLR